MKTHFTNELLKRTKSFALRIIRLSQSLPKTDVGFVIGKQILRSGTSVGAQYREAKRARSKAEFLAKVQSSMQELEETAYWLELLIESETIPSKKLEMLLQEQDEIMSMFVSTCKTLKSSF